MRLFGGILLVLSAVSLLAAALPQSVFVVHCEPTNANEAMWQELGDDGLMVVGVNTDPASARSKIKPYVTRQRLTYMTVLDPDNNVLDTYNPTRELPYAVLIDRDGNIFKTFAGYRTGDEKMVEGYVRQLLDLDGTATGESEDGGSSADG